MKSGWQTSEFWLTLVANVLAFAVAFGVIPLADKETVSGAVTQIVTGAFALLAGGAALWKYIDSRRALKSVAAEAHVLAAIHPDARTEADKVGMPWLTLIMLAIQFAGNLPKLIEAIRNWRKPA